MENENKEGPQVIAEFSACPHCGSKRRFVNSIADEQRQKGLFGDDVVGVFGTSGALLDPKKMSKMVIGTKIPAFDATLDICIDCGTVYAVRLIRSEAMLQVQMGKSKFQMPPGFGNPSMQ